MEIQPLQVDLVIIVMLEQAGFLHVVVVFGLSRAVN
jgi:hypothetical protein